MISRLVPFPERVTLALPTSATLLNIAHLIPDLQSPFTGVYTDEALTTAYDGGVAAASAGDKLYFTFALHRGSVNNMSKFQGGDILESWIPGTHANIRKMEVTGKTDGYMEVTMLANDAGAGDTVDDATALTIISTKWSGYLVEASTVGHATLTALTLRAQDSTMPTTMYGPNLLGSLTAPTTTLGTSCSPDRPTLVSNSQLFVTCTVGSGQRLCLTFDPYYRGGNC